MWGWITLPRPPCDDTFWRPANTAGNAIGSGLTGVLYVLDEPSIGLHQRDNGRLLQTLTKLRDLGNTLIVVEHDEETIRAADHIVDIGPGAGVHGGRLSRRVTWRQC